MMNRPVQRHKCRHIIPVYKGNSVSILIEMTDKETGDPIELCDGDYVLFTVINKTNKKVIQKKLTSEDYDPSEECLVCNIYPEDTLSLPVGEYDSDCLLVTGIDTPSTFGVSTFCILPAVGKITDASTFDTNTEQESQDSEDNIGGDPDAG